MPPEMETPAPAQEEIQQETQAPEPVAEEAAQAAPVAAEPVAQTEEPEASPVATQEPEPPHKEEEVSPSFDPDLVSRLGELESKIKDYESREVKRAEEDRQQAERSREGLLEEFGILDPMYSRLAPSISEADPRTPEGKEVIRQWMTKHPNLFKKSPTLEKITDGSTKEVRQGFGKKLSFGDAIRKLRG